MSIVQERNDLSFFLRKSFPLAIIYKNLFHDDSKNKFYLVSSTIITILTHRKF